ncbi:uncharacterized protein PODANS_5_3450, partial [Podospora anserina S mat+]
VSFHFFLPSSPLTPFPVPQIQHPGATTGLDANNNPYVYISGLHGSGRLPQPPPLTHPGFPAANLINSTGGAGAEPGFNYFFPTEHADVIVLQSAVAPWKLTEGYTRLDYWTVKVPGNITMGELLAGLGVSSGNGGLYVVYQQGNGKWEHQESMTGVDGRLMRRSVREMGWCRRGREGKVRRTYIWVQRV